MSNSDKTRHVILDRALAHVVFDGWSWKALKAAAKDANIDPIMLKSAFPKGPRDLVYYFSESADKLMLEELGHLDIGS
ncbi:MAG TPA: COQ9 family protein, partial [Rhodospirillales bacterium]|nr:COQ9 family protein [Rhodospirillales bacterium]